MTCHISNAVQPAPVVQARQKKRMMFGEQHLARFGSMTARQGADLAQAAGQQPFPTEQDLHPQVSFGACQGLATCRDSRTYQGKSLWY